MHIQIIGFGVVGKAQAHLIKVLGHDVSIYDPYIFPESRLNRNADISFICTHEKDVEDALKRLVEEGVLGLYVIKSTVPVGTTMNLMKRYGVHVCHNPEFLREKYAYEDVLNPSRIIIGKCCDNHASLLTQLYSPLKKPIFITDPTTSELAKLVSNAYLATLITFWNEVNELTSKLNINIRDLAEMVCADPRMSKYGTEKFGEPFSGKCLPKDLVHFIEAFRQNGLNPTVLEAIKRFNENLLAAWKVQTGSC